MVKAWHRTILMAAPFERQIPFSENWQSLLGVISPKSCRSVPRSKAEHLGDRRACRRSAFASLTVALALIRFRDRLHLVDEPQSSWYKYKSSDLEVCNLGSQTIYCGPKPVSRKSSQFTALRASLGIAALWLHAPKNLLMSEISFA